MKNGKGGIGMNAGEGDNRHEWTTQAEIRKKTRQHFGRAWPTDITTEARTVKHEGDETLVARSTRL